jgi:hypothetical protein
VPRHDNLSVRLDHDRVRLSESVPLCVDADPRQYPSAIAEGNVERAVTVIADQTEIDLCTIVAVSGNEDLAVGLRSNCAALVPAKPETRDLFPGSVKGRVQVARRRPNRCCENDQTK